MKKHKDSLLRALLAAAISLAFAELLLGAEGPTLSGPERVSPGCLAIFEIQPAQEASWAVAPTLTATGTWYADSGKARLIFASPKQGVYTVIASVVVEGVPQTLTATLTNGQADDSDGDKEDKEDKKKEEANDLCSWVTLQVPLLVKSASLTADCRAVAKVFKDLVGSIDSGRIKTAGFARNQMAAQLTAALALSGATAASDWQEFLGEFNKQLTARLGAELENLTSLRSNFVDLGATFESLGKTVVVSGKAVAEPKKVSAAPLSVSAPAPVSGCAGGVCPVKQN